MGKKESRLQRAEAQMNEAVHLSEIEVCSLGATKVRQEQNSFHIPEEFASSASHLHYFMGEPQTGDFCDIEVVDVDTTPIKDKEVLLRSQIGQ